MKRGKGKGGKRRRKKEEYTVDDEEEEEDEKREGKAREEGKGNVFQNKCKGR